MSDTLHDTMERLREFRDSRQWTKYHTPEKLARAVAVEAGELNELFLWGNEPTDSEVRDEMADVMIFCLNICLCMGLDPVEEISWKISQNENRLASSEGKLQEGTT